MAILRVRGPMPPHWKDLHTVDTQQWVGLEFTVEPRPRPSWRVEAADRRHLRLTRAGQPLLWAQVEPGYWGMRWLLGTEEHPSCLPPLQARDIEALNEALSEVSGSPAWFAAWARHFTRALDSTPHSPLHAGTWRLMRALPFAPGVTWPPGPEALGPDLVNDVEVGCPRAAAAYEHFGVQARAPLLGLRLESHLSPSRLKAWRKRARDGTLPPVLALYVSPLNAYVVLDGHHRWRAALDARCPVPLMTLSPTRRREYGQGTDAQEQQRVERIFHAGTSQPEPHARDAGRPISVERLNELAVRAWDSRPLLQTRTRAWPHPGGLAAWHAEVRERLAGLGSAVPPEFAESFLLPRPGPSQ